MGRRVGHCGGPAPRPQACGSLPRPIERRPPKKGGPLGREPPPLPAAVAPRGETFSALRVLLGDPDPTLFPQLSLWRMPPSAAAPPRRGGRGAVGPGAPTMRLAYLFPLAALPAAGGLRRVLWNPGRKPSSPGGAGSASDGPLRDGPCREPPPARPGPSTVCSGRPTPPRAPRRSGAA